MKRIYEVGDKIKSRRKLGRLPAGSVVVNRWGFPLLIGRTVTIDIDGGLDAFNAAYCIEDNAPYVVVHVAALSPDDEQLILQ